MKLIETMTSQFQHEMRIVSFINDAQIIERDQLVIEPWLAPAAIYASGL